MARVAKGNGDAFSALSLHSLDYIYIHFMHVNVVVLSCSFTKVYIFYFNSYAVFITQIIFILIFNEFIIYFCSYNIQKILTAFKKMLLSYQVEK